MKRLRDFNSSRFRLENEIAAFAASIPDGAKVLDAGCGHAPYRALFSHTVYKTADFMQVDKEYAQEIDYVCDLADVPVEDNTFDYIVCSQVAEHLPNPITVFQELNRLLKPGGKLLCSAPLFFEEHEKPYDFFRYTQFGWQHILSSANFQVDKIEWMEGFFGSVAYLCDMINRNLPLRPGADRHPFVATALAPVMFFTKVFALWNSILFHRLEKHMKITAPCGAKNYICTATKL